MNKKYEQEIWKRFLFHEEPIFPIFRTSDIFLFTRHRKKLLFEWRTIMNEASIYGNMNNYESFEMRHYVSPFEY